MQPRFWSAELKGRVQFGGVCVNLRTIVFFFIGLSSLPRFSSAIQVFWSHTIDTHGRTPLDEWSARRRGLYLHRTTQQTNIHTLSGIRTRNSSNQATADPRHRRRGHWGRLKTNLKEIKLQDANRTHLSQDWIHSRALACTPYVPRVSVKGGEFLD
jgi:hypothetical protein